MPIIDPEVAKEYRKQYYLKNKEILNSKRKEKQLENGKKEIDYSNGKIYKIEPKIEHEENEIYIGSTVMKYLSQRMRGHHKAYQSWKNGKAGKFSSFDLFDKYGFENCEIILLETTTNAKCIDELRAREKHFIKSLKCVNRNIVCRTQAEYYLDNKEIISEKKKIYVLENKSLIKKQKHDDYLKHKDLRIAKKKIYISQNKDLIKQKKHDAYLKNKDLIKQQKHDAYLKNKDRRFECDCGMTVLYLGKQRHLNTNKHKQLMLNKNL